MVRYSFTRLAILAALAAGSLAKPVVSVEKVVRQDVEQSNQPQSSITAPDGEVIVSSSGHFVIGPTETVTLSTITKNEFETHGVTFAFEGGAAGNAVPQPTAAPKDPPIPWLAGPAGPPPEGEEDSSPPPDEQGNGGDPPADPPVNGPGDSQNETGDDGNFAENPPPNNSDEGDQQGSGESGEQEGAEDAETGDESEGQGEEPANPEDGEGTPPETGDNGGTGHGSEDGGPPPGTEDGEGEGLEDENEEGGPPPGTEDGEETNNEEEGGPPPGTEDNDENNSDQEGGPPPGTGDGGGSGDSGEGGPPPGTEDNNENNDDEEVGPPPGTEDNNEDNNEEEGGGPPPGTGDTNGNNDNEEGGPPPGTEDNNESNDDEEGGPPPGTEDNEENNDTEEGGPPPGTEDDNENDDDDGAGGILPVPVPGPPPGDNPNPPPGDNPDPTEGEDTEPEDGEEEDTEDEDGEEEDTEPEDSEEEDTEPEEDPDDEEDEPTTSATSTTEPEKPAQTNYCSPRTCGGELCPAKRGGSGLAKRAVARKNEPEQCKWAGPENYEDPKNFMANEASLANSDEYDGSEMVPIDEGTMEAGFTSKTVDFSEEPVSLAVPRLVGCTSIIVVSTRGAWASHIWEEPVFVPNRDNDLKYITPGEPFYSPGHDEFPREQQLAYFRTNALERMHTTGNIDGVSHEYALDELRKDEELFDDASKPHVFMFIPYKRIEDKSDPNYNVEKPNGVPAAWDKDGNPSPRGDEESDSYNDQMRKELQEIFGGGVEVERVLYAPDVIGGQDDAEFENARGRALVQYQPAGKEGCGESEAKWRVYFEKETEPHKEFKWDPWEDQRCIPEGDSKRQDECSPKPGDLDNDEEDDNPDDEEGGNPDDGGDDNPDDGGDDNPGDEEDDSSDEEDEPEEPPPQPLKENPPICNNEDDFPGHAELGGGGQQDGAEFVCNHKPGFPPTIKEADAGGEPFEARWSDEWDNHYDFSIYWEEGCTTEEKTQDLFDPLGDSDNTCIDFFVRAYDDCINGGVGGKIKVGCVVYQYDGGRG